MEHPLEVAEVASAAVAVVASLEYNNKSYEIEVIKKDNKNTYIRVKDGKIIVTTNYFASSNYISKLIKSNEKTIGKMIDKYE